MTDNEMRRAWNDTGSRLKEIETPNRTPLDSGRRTALANLAQRYLKFSRLSLIMTLCSPCYMLSSVFTDDWRYIVALCFCIYFAVAGVMDYWLYRGVSSIDVGSMTVSEVARKSIFYRRRHLQFIAVLIPMAVIAIGIMVYAFGFNRDIIAGMACGAIVGLAIGSRQLIAFMDDYRTLRRL